MGSPNWSYAPGRARLTPADHVNRALARLSVVDTVRQRLADMVDELRVAPELVDLATTDAALLVKRGCKR